MKTKFPYDHELFKDDIAILEIVKQLEHFVEIKFDMISVATGISALSRFFPSNEEIKLPPRDEKYHQMMKDMEPFLNKYEKNKTPFQRKRDQLQDLNNDLGHGLTMLFTNPDLVMSLEIILSGILLMYSKAFKSSRRRRILKPRDIFKNEAQKQLHGDLIDMRDKHFAHSEWEHNKHFLELLVNDSGDQAEPVINKHESAEFCGSINYHQFEILVRNVISYSEHQLHTKRQQLHERLSKPQLDYLKTIST
jgi:hypothetical protein